MYAAETETHFPHLTVGQTLQFAALARTPRNRIKGVKRKQYATHVRDVAMAAFGLSHTVNTKVGDEYIRGVSGGERKRVSIAEVMLSGSPLQCWDNSTRGLDSATALEFLHNLRLSADLSGAAIFVSLYQASQDAYDLFDKVTLLYEGKQIYFGPASMAKQYFEDMGYLCPDRQTTGDFLTSLTSPGERTAKPGFENVVPNTAEEFAERWNNSNVHKQLLEEIDAFDQEFPTGGPSLEVFKEARKAQKAKATSSKSSYTVSIPMQINLCITRGFQRLNGDKSRALTTILGNWFISLIIASIFYNMPASTSSFFSRGSLLFFATLLNAFMSILEIFDLYDQRPIVEKHARYALYHPFSEGVASMIVDLPIKISSALGFNFAIYFMSNLRREPGPFFIFFLFAFTCTLTMSMIFRTIGALSRTVSEALVPASLLVLSLVIYTGFIIPVSYMKPWFRWINYINPIAYVFESFMANEFSGRNFECNSYVPSGPGYPPEGVENFQPTCAVPGAEPGVPYVSGANYIEVNFGYSRSHLWRNYGILIGFAVFFCFTYLYATEKVSASKSKGEVLVFKKGHIPIFHHHQDVESVTDDSHMDAVSEAIMERVKSAHIESQRGIFQWKDVCYDIPVTGIEKTRRLLDHVDGWIQPGTLTALMGASGAGKTTLLDVLASRVTMGVVTGDMLVNGTQRDTSFQRKTGYVQQQDLHLSTSTVREALTFSALLRQPRSIPKAEKIAYVDEVIKVLEMDAYSDAVVGVPGEGLNVEQRKRLTIGVELAAKPELLLFLDEPTSGLDSQTAWSICQLMRSLANSGQAIMCTIHQPSAMLFQQFDRLLFLQHGGQTVYFGDIGENSSTLIKYFERNGAFPCPQRANPAEWMLQVIGAAPGSITDQDWFDVWTNSPERKDLRDRLDEIEHSFGTKDSPATQDSDSNSQDKYQTFATGYFRQTLLVTERVWQQYWRTPDYIWSKAVLCVISPLFVGFSFYKADNSLQGLQDQMFAFFMLFVVFISLTEQIMPQFVTQRSLYEVRERPSKVYSWQSFMISNLVVEMPWQTLMAVFSFFCFYYPVGLFRNAEWTHDVHERGALFFLLVWTFYLFTSTFSHLVVSSIENPQTAATLSTLLFAITLAFCGVVATVQSMPGFWIFVYRLSPFTYLVSAMMSAGLANAPVVCSASELVPIAVPLGMTCGELMKPYMLLNGGAVVNASSTVVCEFCTMSNTNEFLYSLNVSYGDRWRNLGFMFVYILFNCGVALFLYWLVRVPKKWHWRGHHLSAIHRKQAREAFLKMHHRMQRSANKALEKVKSFELSKLDKH